MTTITPKGFCMSGFKVRTCGSGGLPSSLHSLSSESINLQILWNSLKDYSRINKILFIKPLGGCWEKSVKGISYSSRITWKHITKTFLELLWGTPYKNLKRGSERMPWRGYSMSNEAGISSRNDRVLWYQWSLNILLLVFGWLIVCYLNGKQGLLRREQNSTYRPRAGTTRSC